MNDKYLHLQRISQFEVPPDLGHATSILPLTICGPTCFSMVSLYYHTKFDPELNPYVSPKKAIEAIGLRWHGSPEKHVIAEYGVEPQALLTIANKCGYKADFFSRQTIKDIKIWINRGSPPIVFVGSKDKEKHKGMVFREEGKRWEFVAGEHTVVVDGYKETEKMLDFFVKDPLYPQNIKYTRKEFFTATRIKAKVSYKGLVKLLNSELVIIYPYKTR